MWINDTSAHEYERENEWVGCNGMKKGIYWDENQKKREERRYHNIEQGKALPELRARKGVTWS